MGGLRHFQHHSVMNVVFQGVGAGRGENTNLAMCPWLGRLVFDFVQGEGGGRHNTNLVM